MQSVEKKKKELGVDYLIQLELLECNIKKEIEYYNNDDSHNGEREEESIHNVYRDGKVLIFHRLIEELSSIQKMFSKKFDLYDTCLGARQITKES